MTDLRLLPAAVVAWLVAGVAVAAPAWVAAVIAVVFGACAAVCALRARGLRSVLALVAIALAGGALVAAAVAAQTPGRTPAVLADAAASGRIVTLRVEATSRAAEGRLTATVLAATSGATTTAVSVPVLVLGDAEDHALRSARIGEILRLDATLRSADAGDAVAYLAFPRGDPVIADRPPPLLRAADAVRVALVRATRDLPGDGGRLLPGLAIGDTAQVTPDLGSAMKASSLTHLTAVSGANCAIVVGLVLWGAAALGLPRLVRLAVAAAALVGFVVLVTPQGSVIRAAVMAGVALAALGLGRAARGLPLLCVAAIVLLTTDPWLARDYGFALSALATGGLLLLAAPIARVVARVLPRRLSLLLAVPVAAQLACQPVILLLNPALPVYGVAANLLAEPAAPVVTVLGLAACAVAPVLPGLATGIAWLAWIPAAWIGAVARFTAGLPGAQSPWPPGIVGVALLVVVTVVGLLALLGGTPARLRRVARAVLLVGVVGYLASVVGVHAVTVAGRPADWEIGLCDVGQGDATLVRSGDRVGLVDTGPDPAKLSACLTELGIGRIDLLVLTHYDLDHVGGTDAVAGRVDRVLIGPPSDPGDARLADELRGGGARVDQVAMGDHGTLGALRWRVVWPPPTGVEPGNPASVTLTVVPDSSCPHCLTGILLGDLGEESQDRLLGLGDPGRFDVVKVAHHGSADQAPELYAALRPALGLIGVGAGNDYGHPTSKLLGTLAANGVTPLRTDLDGMVLVAPGDRPHEARVWRQKHDGREATLTGPELAAEQSGAGPRRRRRRGSHGRASPAAGRLDAWRHRRDGERPAAPPGRRDRARRRSRSSPGTGCDPPPSSS
ncbi:ComEC/Rec2 family competence protein [Pseudolysinimonas sp.]|uniref:ComEC/Rec2 family competence protein n=1 Tax=Pseudolysinimonas sp. TaxID=2680009 RepID=UPI003F7D40BE